MVGSSGPVDATTSDYVPQNILLTGEAGLELLVFQCCICNIVQDLVDLSSLGSRCVEESLSSFQWSQTGLFMCQAGPGSSPHTSSFSSSGSTRSTRQAPFKDHWPRSWLPSPAILWPTSVNLVNATQVVVLDKLDYCATLRNLDSVRDHKNFKVGAVSLAGFQLSHISLDEHEWF
jgi:hypothetical protein